MEAEAAMWGRGEKVMPKDAWKSGREGDKRILMSYLFHFFPVIPQTLVRLRLGKGECEIGL